MYVTECLPVELLGPAARFGGVGGVKQSGHTVCQKRNGRGVDLASSCLIRCAPWGIFPVFPYEKSLMCRRVREL